MSYEADKEVRPIRHSGGNQASLSAAEPTIQQALNSAAGLPERCSTVGQLCPSRTELPGVDRSDRLASDHRPK